MGHVSSDIIVIPNLVLQAVTPLKVVAPNSALRLRAILDFDDETGDKRIAGDEWLFEGPGRACCNTTVF